MSTESNSYSGGITMRRGMLVDGPVAMSGDALGAAAGAVTFAGTLGTPATLSLAAAQPGNGGTFGHALTNFGFEDALDPLGPLTRRDRHVAVGHEF